MVAAPQNLIVDLETYYHSIDGYTLKKMSMTEYLRDKRFRVLGLGYKLDKGSPTWIPLSQVKWWTQQIDWANTVLWGHNVRFDGAALAWHYGVKPLQYVDTMGLSRAILGGRLSRHSLDAVSRHYGFEPKGILQTDGLCTLSPKQEQELAEYCLHDVDLTAKIAIKLWPLFPKSQQAALDWTIRSFVEAKLEIDTKKAEAVATAERQRRETIFAEIGIDRKVFSSNPQFAELLAQRGYEVPTKKSPRTGLRIPALALGDPEFLAMRDSEDKQLADLCEARIAAKANLLETRAEKLLKVGRTGPFPFDVNFSGAQQTHRYSGGAGAGGNPQNFPRGEGLRECIIAPEGHSLVVGDFSAIELRIQAWLANEPKLTSVLAAGGDPYCDFASQLYKRPITKADKAERFMGKTAILGLGYMMGAKKFARTVLLQTATDIGEARAKETVDLYRTYYSQIPALWRQLDAYLPLLAQKASGVFKFAPFLRLENGNIVLPSGLKIQYPGLAYDISEKQWKYYSNRAKTLEPTPSYLYGGKLLEGICQALAGEILKIATQRACDEGICVVGSVHDELLCVVPKNLTAAYVEKLRRIMSTKIPFWPDLMLSAETGGGNNWASAKN